MENFILKFGKYKGQQFFDVPQSYQNWLLEQKFTVGQSEIDNLKEGDNINLIYRSVKSQIGGRSGTNGTNVSFKNTYVYTSYQGFFIKQRKGSIMINMYNTDIRDDNGQPFGWYKAEFNKSTIASISILS